MSNVLVCWLTRPVQMLVTFACQPFQFLQLGCVVQNMSTIPLGKGGFSITHDGLTENGRNYRQFPIDVMGNYEANKRAVLANNGPTSTVGVTLGGRLRV
jgi:hypothetical protein